MKMSNRPCTWYVKGANFKWHYEGTTDQNPSDIATYACEDGRRKDPRGVYEVAVIDDLSFGDVLTVSNNFSNLPHISILASDALDRAGFPELAAELRATQKETTGKKGKKTSPTK